jgi:hypothetical protein
VRDLVANVLARLRATNRQQRLYLALGLVAVLVLVRFGASWFLEYRRDIKEDIRLSAQRIANARVMLQRAPEVERHLADLEGRYKETLARLVPGDTPTLASAALQDKVSSLAAENNVRVQTTQVLKDEAVGSFRQVSLRVTASGDLRDLAGFLAGLEFGALQVQVSFIELTRRGAAIRRRPDQEEGARTVSATIQVSGILQGSAAPEGEGVQPAAAEGAGTAPSAQAPFPAAPPEALEPQITEPPLADIPTDPLGTGGLVTPQ